jgi:hypothetical protein
MTTLQQGEHVKLACLLPSSKSVGISQRCNTSEKDFSKKVTQVFVNRKGIVVTLQHEKILRRYMPQFHPLPRPQQAR